MKTLGKLFLAAAMLLLVSSNVTAQSQSSSVEKEIIAMTYNQWKAEMKKDFAGATSILADDYTEFSPDFATRVDGKKTNSMFWKTLGEGNSSVVAAEMLNAKVQVYGDVAILTYNYAGANKNKDGEIEPVKAKSTRVYAKINGAWKMVHANFAPEADTD